jgi:exopolysaccharide biosynthesis polyprenyl glycosylphosphotransferase
MTLLDDLRTTERGRRQPPLRGRARTPWPLRLRDPVPPASREVAPAPDYRTRDRRSLTALVVADLTGTALALILAANVLSPDFVLGPASLLFPPLVFGLAMCLGLYRRDEMVIRKTTLDEAPQLSVLAGIAALIAWLLSKPLFGGDIGRFDVVSLFCLLGACVLLMRRAGRFLALRRAPEERCLLLGDAAAGDRLAAAFAGAKHPGRIVARVPPHRITYPDAETSHERISARALSALVEQHSANRVIVSGEATDHAATLDILRASRVLNVRVSFLPTVLGAIGGGLTFEDVHGVPLIAVQRFGLTRGQRVVKRCLDLVGAGIGLALLSPLFALIALAIRLDSGGPVFFRQTRIGRDGHAFGIFKFRTMDADAEARKDELRARNEAGGGLFKIADDPRITRVGRLLRRTSLDELPQLINVMIGQMSLVGPRPLVVDEDARILGWDRRRLHLTPGMTGHWQILGSSRVPLQEMVKIDYRYVASWTLWNDVKLLLRTVPYVLARRGM